MEAFIVLFKVGQRAIVIKNTIKIVAFENFEYDPKFHHFFLFWPYPHIKLHQDSFIIPFIISGVIPNTYRQQTNEHT